MGALLKALSKKLLGILIAVILFPLFALVWLLISLMARIAFEYFAFSMKRNLNNLSNIPERELMEGHLNLEFLLAVLTLLQEDVKKSREKRLYNLLLNGGISKSVDLTKKMIASIEARVYPQLNAKPTQEQMQRLLKVYEGMEAY